MSNQRILLIDYDPASIRRTVTPLAKAGYQVEVANDGISGLAAFERLNPALVLVEAMLPRKHGFEVCQEIKDKPGGETTPVLITTAVCRGRKYRMDALQIYGCDEYIEKPIADDELLKIIGRFLEQAAKAREEIQAQLSDAIDSAADSAAASAGNPTGETEVGPEAIESMSDDELEAKIDALLMGPETADGGEPAPPLDAREGQADNSPSVATVEDEAEPSIEPTSYRDEPAEPESDPVEAAADLADEPDEPSPVDLEAIPTADAEPEVHGALDTDAEMERRVAAMTTIAPPDTAATPLAADEADEADEAIEAIEAEGNPHSGASPPASEASPGRDVVAAPTAVTEDPHLDSAASADESEDATPEASPREWTEPAAASKRSGSKVVWIAVGLAAAIAVAGFFGFRQGWFGGATPPAPAGAEADASLESAGYAAPVALGGEAAAAAEPDVDPEGGAEPPLDSDSEAIDLSSSGDSEPAAAEPVAQAAPAPSPRPSYDGPSEAEIAAAKARAVKAERSLNRLAGSVREEIVTPTTQEPLVLAEDTTVPVELDDPLIGTPERPKPMRGQLFDLEDVDQAPVPLEFVQPVYDELARRLRQQGEVLVSVLIDENGRVTEAKLIQEIPRSRLNRSALQAAQRWTYRPALKDGVAVSVWKTERILFNLD